MSKRNALLALSGIALVIISTCWSLSDGEKIAPQKWVVITADDRPLRQSEIRILENYQSQFSQDSSKSASELIYGHDFTILSSTAELVERLQNSNDNTPLLIELVHPTLHSAKQLKASLTTSLIRPLGLQRVIPVVSLNGGEHPYNCSQFENDIIFADWNFGGIAFRLSDDALAFLSRCSKPPE
ncbi:hypothetical protein [Lacimicrobium alkaliphilum]|uniref:Uncharacterized protein n=1 Tax=Lacimicrobium alkaliphilum TaxID=1526571 RepID=A0A0U3B241_9ALTE|nr:hypothetical protein [Lacimicrobium alkaliphilum]ALS99320.1 hypothetical protein AT746_14340 [Lacimicrobium alkaliphilum]